MIPPKPPSRPEKVTLRRYVRLFRQDILSAQPAKLFRAWMAEFRTPFFRSYLVNQPELLDVILKERPDDFPKSDRIAEGLRPLLGNSVFLTNGETWKRQRRIIDPAFAGGRLRDTFPAMKDAADHAVARLHDGPQDIEPATSYAAADVIFRTLFSIPIDHEIAQQVFEEFRTYQRTQPILNIAAFIPLPRWMPRLRRRATLRSAQKIRRLITDLTMNRMQEIQAGTAPDDLATKIMTTPDPETGALFSTEEMVDQVAIFFLAGHETSASALAWALYLCALFPDWQDRIAAEAARHDFTFANMSKLTAARDVFRETLRLYPPVPMMVRECAKPENFRNRPIPQRAQMVLSPWHLHRHNRLWDNPDGFDPTRWQTKEGQNSARCAYMPFSSGPRVCTGAGFAMIEGALLLSMILKNWRVEPIPNKPAMPNAHLTVRGKDGIWLNLSKR